MDRASYLLSRAYANSVSGGGGGTGNDGVGIESIILTGTVGLVDTYTITYTDGTTSTFDVTNGADGQDGLTTSVTLNGETITQVDGVIALGNLVEPPALIASSDDDVVIASLGDNEAHGYAGSVLGEGIDSLTITSIDQTYIGGESVILIDTGDNFTFSYPTSIGVIGSDEMDDNSTYVISIQAGVMVIGKVEVTA